MPKRAKQHQSSVRAQNDSTVADPLDTYRWQQFRSWFRTKHPLCAICLTKGNVVPMAQVHHIKPWRERPDLTFEESNCQSLCTACHAIESAKERGYTTTKVTGGDSFS